MAPATATAPAPATSSIHTFADLISRIGEVPYARILFHPPMGTATVADVIRLREKDGKLCELVEGVLLEKAVGLKESRLAGLLITFLNIFVLAKRLGFVTGEAGTVQLFPNHVRIPDCAFISWDRCADGRQPDEPVPLLVPNLAVEVLSASNTRTEMAVKRVDYFQAGVDLVWEFDPDGRTVDVYTSATDHTTLSVNDTLDGSTVLPGFQLPLKDLFDALDQAR